MKKRKNDKNQQKDGEEVSSDSCDEADPLYNNQSVDAKVVENKD